MKSIKYIFTLAIFVTFWSCESLIEEPKSVLSPDSFFTSEDDLKAAVVACYNPFLGRYEEDIINGPGGWETLGVRSWALHMGADDLTSRPGTNKQRLVDFDIFRIPVENSDNEASWRTYYKIIANCNNVTDNYLKVPMEEAERDALAAQSFFLRAYAYFQIVRFWGAAPLITAPVKGDGMDILRSPVEDIYEQIILDAQFAEQHLPEVWSGEPGAANLGAAKTLLANVYLTMAGWPLKQSDKYALAAQKAKEVIDIGIYTLVPDFKDLFTLATQNGPEHIWNIQAHFDDHPSHFGTSFEPKEEGWSDYLAEVKFLEDCPDNYRKQSTFYTVFEGNLDWRDSELGLPCFSKYWDPDFSDKDSQQSGKVFPIYRYAEVLLIYAEAQNRANGGPDASCYQALNDIRRRANGNVDDDAPASLSMEDFDKAVFDEKGWEFAAEQKRWHDLVRKELVEEYNQFNDQITVTITKENYLFPIPSSEIDINPNITQNPGY